ncbi:sarcosine oxidase subunit delta [Brachybacterium paraconglomeratum]|uniref:sarcosine oxidase subunit delta n=1 Tax=Brachybacterium paraconglomeratum TaxID=173362 RepID=UPI003F7BA3DA
MLLIDCPHCGPRNEVEFHYGGEAHVPYPEDPSALDDREWSRYLFYRANTKGILAERWQHSAGCRKWFNALRDTRTYRFERIYPMGSPRPDLPEAEKVPADAAEPDRFASMTTTEGRTDGSVADPSVADPSAAGSAAADGSTPAPEARTGNEDDHA